MGTTGSARSTGLASALFTPVQARVLALLFGQPTRRYQGAELIRLAHGGTGAVHRQLARLADAGLVTVTAIGNQKHYQANAHSPVFAELRGLVQKLTRLWSGSGSGSGRVQGPGGVRHGSVAKGTDRPASDVDLMIVSDSLRHAQVFEALSAAEAMLSRPVNPTLLSRSDWRAKRAKKNSFVSRVMSGPRLFVIGSDSDLD